MIADAFQRHSRRLRQCAQFTPEPGVRVVRHSTLARLLHWLHGDPELRDEAPGGREVPAHALRPERTSHRPNAVGEPAPVAAPPRVRARGRQLPPPRPVGPIHDPLRRLRRDASYVAPPGHPLPLASFPRRARGRSVAPAFAAVIRAPSWLARARPDLPGTPADRQRRHRREPTRASDLAPQARLALTVAFVLLERLAIVR